MDESMVSKIHDHRSSDLDDRVKAALDPSICSVLIQREQFWQEAELNFATLPCEMAGADGVPADEKLQCKVRPSIQLSS